MPINNYFIITETVNVLDQKVNIFNKKARAANKRRAASLAKIILGSIFGPNIPHHLNKHKPRFFRLVYEFSSRLDTLYLYIYHPDQAGFYRHVTNNTKFIGCLF